MAAERAAPERDVETMIPFAFAVEWGALDALRWPNEPAESLDRMLDRDDGRPD